MTSYILAATDRASSWRDTRIFLLYLLAAAVLHFPHYGSFVGDITPDFYLHYNWAKEFAENFALGNPYPRWMFHARLGLGEPTFIFYAPLYYYAVALLSLLGLSTWAAMQVVAVISTAVFAWFVYKTCAYYVKTRLSAMIGLVALASPFLIMLNYKFDGLAWGTMGYASHGFLLWALFRPGASRKLINLWASIAIGIAVGSHIVSALVNLGCYSAMAFFPVSGTDKPLSVRIARSIVSWGATVALGLALSAIYLYPALTDLELLRVGPKLTNLVFHGFAWPIVTQFIYPLFWFSFQWTISLPALALVLAPLAYVLVHKETTAALSSAIAVGAVAVFFASELSYPLWALNTPLGNVNLPFRFVSVVYTLGIVAAGLAVAHARAASREAWCLALGSVLALSFLTGVLTLVKASYLDGTKLPAPVASDEYTFLPYFDLLHDPGFKCVAIHVECPQLTPPSGAFRGTPEYRLKWAESEKDYVDYAKGGFAAECAAKGVTCGPPQRTATGLKWEVTASAPQSLVLPLFHFPSWATEIDGKRVEHTIDPATGLITVAVPAGTHEIQTVWTLSSVERNGLYLSIAAMLILCTLSLLRRLPYKP